MSKLLEAIETCGENDLALLDAQIAEVEKRLEALRLARKIVDAKLNGRQEKKPGKPRGITGGVDDRRVKAARYLAHAGKASLDALATACSVSLSCMIYTLKHDWFQKAGSDYSLTAEGKAATQ